MKPLSLFLLFISIHLATPIDFILNGFNSSSDLLLYGNSTLGEHVLTLTTPSSFTIGRALYPTKVTKDSSFFTSFIFSISPFKDSLPGHGFVFLFTPSTGISGASSAQHLGLFNRTNDGSSENHVFGVEFDVFENPEFNDIDNNHVAVNLNSLTSAAAHPAGYWVDGDEKGESFHELKLNNGVNYQVWIDYYNYSLFVRMAPAGMNRPERALIDMPFNLSLILLDEMYIGFTAATGTLVESHRILSWSFSNSNRFISEALVTSNLPSFVPPGKSAVRSKGFIVGITSLVVFVVGCSAGIYLGFVKRKRRKKREREDMEGWELEYWPHRITYQKIYIATNGFSEENVIGFGGNGKIYKGVMVGGAEVAVKQICQTNEQGAREFLAEVSSLGRLKHRNLVALRGWSKKEKGSLILVCDYMENGSLDKRVFDCEERLMLSWEERIRVLKDVADGILYLHEGWEFKVLHRDIKASNVLLDRDMNGRLGDFGLARIHGHGQVVSSTRVVGTVGYMAPEIVRNGRASAQTDVFALGILILEVVCGRRPIEDGKVPLVDWVWGLMEREELVNALDGRLRAKGGYDYEEVERVLHLGLLCAYPDPRTRPTMRQVAKVFEGTINVYESDREGIEVSLLDKMKSTNMWSKHIKSSHHRGYPTFMQIRESLSSSMSLSESDIIVEGR
ncbi:hypothetical protein GIB67_026641 [Kingdonia uniflora]|uniref:non-specific serine/threonine protein kinase n=1 Tax=Kingdonia uniflora TaxID=39325 RepID=A0A7J7NIR0_9MAGN|nr:hypothetical protein GIB67_026641 [Kingdonia uniflora]